MRFAAEVSPAAHATLYLQIVGVTVSLMLRQAATYLAHEPAQAVGPAAALLVRGLLKGEEPFVVRLVFHEHYGHVRTNPARQLVGGQLVFLEHERQVRAYVLCGNEPAGLQNV